MRRLNFPAIIVLPVALPTLVAFMQSRRPRFAINRLTIQIRPSGLPVHWAEAPYSFI